MEGASELKFDQIVDAAKAAHDRLDWLGAIDLWKTAVRLDPTFVSGHWMAGVLLLQSGQIEEAEGFLTKGVALDPSNISMAVSHARSATLLKIWPEAIKRWIDLSRRAPDNKDVIDGLAEAEMQMRMYRLSNTLGAGPTDKEWKRFLATRATSEDTELFMQFQSIGDNCEFGLVQRHFLAEPMSLLRWNSINIKSLTLGVQNGFAGMGDPEHTTLFVGQNDEYALSDHRYNTAMHTFLKRHLVQESPEELFEKMCKRQAYLRRQFVEDLEEGRQIFVFKSVQKTTLEDVRTLHEAMEQHGPNHLLFAVEASEHRPARSVEELSPRLYVGAIDHFSHLGDGWDNLHFDTWRSVCRDVSKRVRKSEGLKGLMNRVIKGSLS